MDPELAAEAADVRPHGGVADVEPGPVVAAGDALGHQTQHLLLARREALEPGVHRTPPVEQRRDGARGEERSAREHGADGIDDLGGRLRLVDERAGASLDGREARSVTVLSREEDEPGLRPHLADAQPGVRSGAVVEAKVDEDDVRLELIRSHDRVRHRGGMADNGHIGLVVEQGRQAVRHNLMVLDDQDPDPGLAHGADGIDGTQNSTLVPLPGSLVTSHHPPASKARSLSARRPRCPGRWLRSPTTKPRPSSITSPWMPPSRSLTAMWTRVADACFSTLVSASDTCLKMIVLISQGCSSGSRTSISASTPVMVRI